VCRYASGASRGDEWGQVWISSTARDAGSSVPTRSSGVASAASTSFKAERGQFPRDMSPTPGPLPPSGRQAPPPAEPMYWLPAPRHERQRAIYTPVPLDRRTLARMSAASLDMSLPRDSGWLSRRSRWRLPRVGARRGAWSGTVQPLSCDPRRLRWRVRRNAPHTRLDEQMMDPVGQILRG
jgi:hypothetical protein